MQVLAAKAEVQDQIQWQTEQATAQLKQRGEDLSLLLQEKEALVDRLQVVCWAVGPHTALTRPAEVHVVASIAATHFTSHTLLVLSDASCCADAICSAIQSLARLAHCARHI